MASSQRDFERFVVWLHQPENLAHADVHRLANLILANFDGVARTTRNRSQRSIYLVQQVHLNRRWVPAREIRDAVYGHESSGRSERISEIFKGNTRWQDYIEQDGAGQYSIKLD